MDGSYEMRRLKNNEAVKKSREKSRNQTQTIIDKINELKSQNEEYRERKAALETEIEELKKMFFQQADSSGRRLTLTQEDIEFLKDENIAVKK